MVIHLFAKIGFAGSEAGTSLKLVEKGFRREDLAVMVLIDFPFQIVGGWLAAKWSRGDRPLRPWIYAFWPRFFFASTAALIVYYFPKQPIPLTFFLLMIVHTVLSSFATYVHQSSCLFLTEAPQDCTICWHFGFPYSYFGSHYWRNIHDGRHYVVKTWSWADPHQLLATFSNMGGTWPKWFVLKGTFHSEDPRVWH
jgi:PAT family acetyl-CoA transporter-like MFS transporter 1